MVYLKLYPGYQSLSERVEFDSKFSQIVEGYKMRGEEPLSSLSFFYDL